MRVGQNPAKSIDQVAKPADITVAIVTYIPYLGGYYAESLEVPKVCLESLWRNTDLPYDLLVFDNASCPEVRQFLSDAQQDGKIQFLISSDKNIGKGGAWNLIFTGAPGISSSWRAGWHRTRWSSRAQHARAGAGPRRAACAACAAG